MLFLLCMSQALSIGSRHCNACVPFFLYQHAHFVVFDNGRAILRVDYRKREFGNASGNVARKASRVKKWISEKHWRTQEKMHVYL